MRGIVNRGKLAFPKQCVVLLSFGASPKPCFPANVMRVIVVLMDSQHNLRHIHHRNTHRTNLPKEPVVISRPANSEGGYLLVQQSSGKYELIDPLRRSKLASFASHGTQALVP